MGKKGTLRRLLGSVIQKKEEKPKKVYPGRIAATSEILFRKIEEEMSVNHLYQDPNLTIKDLSVHIGTNRTYVVQAFKYKNTTFKEYLKSYRMEHLRLAIDNECRDIYEIAYDSGFSNRRAMNRVLQEEMGVTYYALKKKKVNDEK